MRLATWQTRKMLLVYDPEVTPRPQNKDKTIIYNVPVYGPLAIVGLKILDRNSSDEEKWDCEFVIDKTETKPDAWALVLVVNGAVCAYGWSYRKMRKCIEEIIRRPDAECFWYIPPLGDPDYSGRRKAEAGIRAVLLEMVSRGYII